MDRINFTLPGSIVSYENGLIKVIKVDYFI